MHTYYYQPPHTKGSSKQMTVYKENSSPIGTIERHFKTIVHKILDTLLGQNNLIVNIQAKDAAGDSHIKANTERAMIKRPHCYLQTKNGKSYKAIQTNQTSFYPEFTITGPNKLTLNTKPKGLHSVNFYHNNQVIAEIDYAKGAKPQIAIRIAKNASMQDPLFYAVYYQMLYFIGY